MAKSKVEKSKDRSLSSDSMWKNDGRFSSIIIPGLIAIIIILVAGLAWFATQNKNSQENSDTIKQELESSRKELQTNIDGLQGKLDDMQKTIDDKKQAEATVAAENEKGFIEGSLGYPSNYIPKDMSVCALNIVTNKEYCTTEQIYDAKYTYKVGYKIEVPAGKYNVYATTSSQTDYKAYYSAFITCGLKSNCTSHDPIEVLVEKDKTTSEVDPVDWYKK